MLHYEVKFVPSERADYEQINTQWSGVLFKPGGAAMTDASYRLDLNTGDTAVISGAKYAHLDLRP